MKKLIVPVFLSFASAAIAAPVCELPWNTGLDSCKKWREQVQGNWGEGTNAVTGYKQITFTVTSDINSPILSTYSSGVRMGVNMRLEGVGTHSITQPAHDGWGKLNLFGVQCGVRDGGRVLVTIPRPGVPIQVVCNWDGSRG